MIPRLHTTVYGFINIWKEPWQACQSKHLEAYDSGTISGDTHYAMSALYQYSDSAIYGCGDNLETLSQNIQSYATRAFRCNQLSIWKSLVVLHQLALDLMGVGENAFSPYSGAGGMTEETCLAAARDGGDTSLDRLICTKRKYSAFFGGDLVAAAAAMRGLPPGSPAGSTGQLLSACVSTFIDGLIGFSLFRKHGGDEPQWLDVGKEAV